MMERQSYVGRVRRESKREQAMLKLFLSLCHWVYASFAGHAEVGSAIGRDWTRVHMIMVGLVVVKSYSRKKT